MKIVLTIVGLEVVWDWRDPGQRGLWHWCQESNMRRLVSGNLYNWQMVVLSWLWMDPDYGNGLVGDQSHTGCKNYRWYSDYNPNWIDLCLPHCCSCCYYDNRDPCDCCILGHDFDCVDCHWKIGKKAGQGMVLGTLKDQVEKQVLEDHQSRVMMEG